MLRQTWKLMSLHFFSCPSLSPSLLAAQSTHCCCVQPLWEFSLSANPLLFEFVPETNGSNWKINSHLVTLFWSQNSSTVPLKYHPTLLQSPKAVPWHPGSHFSCTSCLPKSSLGPSYIVFVRQHFWFCRRNHTQARCKTNQCKCHLIQNSVTIWLLLLLLTSTRCKELKASLARLASRAFLLSIRIFSYISDLLRWVFC